MHINPNSNLFTYSTFYIIFISIPTNYIITLYNGLGFCIFYVEYNNCTVIL